MNQGAHARVRNLTPILLFSAVRPRESVSQDPRYLHTAWCGTYFLRFRLIHICFGQNIAFFIFEHLLFIYELEAKCRLGITLALDPGNGGHYAVAKDIYGVEFHG